MYVIAASSVLLIVFSVRAFFKDSLSSRRRLPAQGVRREIALENLSRIWGKQRNVEISVEKLSTLWKNRNLVPAVAVKVEFSHPELQRFYAENIEERQLFAATAGKVARELLKILDEHGQCPSVVTGDNEKESHLPKSQYDLLAQTTLRVHSLNVAEKLVKATGGGPVMVKALITALAHDIGKIPEFRTSPRYSMGDHPLISANVLHTIKGFNALPYHKEISDAVKLHHLSPRDKLALKLKDADQAARAEELTAHGLPATAIQPSPVIAAPVPATQPPSPSISDEPKERVRIEEIDLPWFDYDEILAELKISINKVIEDDWKAFSMPDGIVYVRPKVIWSAAYKLAEKHGDSSLILQGNADRQFRQRVILSIVNRFREKGFIPPGIVGEGYFSSPFVVKTSEAELAPAYYVPMMAEAFSPTVSALENLKDGKTATITDVRRKLDGEKQ